MKKIQIIAPIIILLSIIIHGNISAQDIVLVANKEVPVESVTNKELKDIYLGNTTIWSNKTRIKPCYMEDVTDFWSVVLDKEYTIFKRYWTQKIYSGYGTAPIKHDSEMQVIDYVSRTPGGIGVINKLSAKNMDSNWKIIEIQ